MRHSPQGEIKSPSMAISILPSPLLRLALLIIYALILFNDQVADLCWAYHMQAGPDIDDTFSENYRLSIIARRPACAAITQ